MTDTAQAFDRLYEIIKTLRAPGGCPWDREQTPLSMRSDLIEETFEAVEAVSNNDIPHVREELGDVFLNTAMIAYMYEQQEVFTAADVLNDISEKLIRRHPHVFPESEGKSHANENGAKTSAEVLSQWDNIKRGVEGRSGESLLDEVPDGFPPLLKAYKMQKKAAKAGFDWTNIEPVWEKVTEEMNEVREAAAEAAAVQSQSASNGPMIPCAKKLHLEQELGDLLFSVINLTRHYGVDPTAALARTNAKFKRRFAYVEQNMKAADLTMNKNNTEKMGEFWIESKKHLNMQ